MTVSPRLAFSTLAFPATPLTRAASLGRDYGYQGIELRLIDGHLIDPSMPPAERAAVKQTVAQAGLPIVAVDTSIRLTDDNPGPEISRFLELASDWEAPTIRVFGGALSDNLEARKDQLKAAAQVLETAVARAEQTGVAIGLETHDSFSCAAQVAELLAMVDSPTIGAVWDSHHPHRMGETPAEVYHHLRDRLLLAQVKDARRAAKAEEQDQDAWRLTLLGQGEVPVRQMLRLLHTGGYQGWISVEWEKHWHPEIEDPELALPQHFNLLTTWLTEEATASHDRGAETR
jgi:sugar phosphate isomerase/epimerase